MFQLHVVLEGPKNWLEYVPPWITAVASLIAFSVAILIARNQNRLQATLADRQRDLQKQQLEQQDRQLKKDLFDRRFAVFTEVLDFMSYVLRENGKIELAGPGQYRLFRESMERAVMLFGDDVTAVDETARLFYVSAQTLDNAVATGNMEAINNNGELLNRLSVTLLGQRTEVFRPYLDLSHKG